MTLSNNPYNYNLPVNPDMFFGRQKDVQTLVQHLAKLEKGDSFALVGGRRMGKTSLLEMIYQELDRQAKELSSNILPLPIFLDFTGEGIDSHVSFFHFVTEETSTLLTTLLKLPHEEPLDLTEGRPPAPPFQRFLQRWGQVVRTEHGCQLRLVLLLDECDQIVAQPWASKLYDALRYLLVGRSTRSLIKIVLAGSHRFFTQVYQDGSPLKNVLTYHNLQVLDPEATHDLINQPSGNVLSKKVVQAVATQSGGHPFLTQYLMHNLCERGLEQATPEMVQKIAFSFPHQRSDFWDWVAGLGDSSAEVYRILIKRKDAAVDEDTIKATLNSPPSNLPQVLDALCYHGVIIKENDEHYRLAGQMFRDWFVANIKEEIGLPKIDLSALRHQLDYTFDDVGLRAFCQDYFPTVFDRFGEGMRKDEKIILLLDYCRRSDHCQRLQALLENHVR